MIPTEQDLNDACNRNSKRYKYICHQDVETGDPYYRVMVCIIQDLETKELHAFKSTGTGYTNNIYYVGKARYLEPEVGFGDYKIKCSKLPKDGLPKKYFSV